MKKSQKQSLLKNKKILEREPLVCYNSKGF